MAYQNNKHEVILQFCREIKGKVSREDFIEIEIQPDGILPSNVALYQRSSILSAIQMDLFGIQEGPIVSLKYYKRPRNNWSNVPETLNVDLNSKEYIIDGNIVIELMFREGQHNTHGELSQRSQSFQQFGQRHNNIDIYDQQYFGNVPSSMNFISPLRPSEGTASSSAGEAQLGIESMKSQIQALEADVAFLKDKIKFMESRFDQIELLPPLLTNELSKIHRHVSAVTLSADENNPEHMIAARLTKIETQSSTSPQQFFDEGKYKLICHQCHSGLEHNQQHNQLLKNKHHKVEESKQEQLSENDSANDRCQDENSDDEEKSCENQDQKSKARLKQHTYFQVESQDFYPDNSSSLILNNPLQLGRRTMSEYPILKNYNNMSFTGSFAGNDFVKRDVLHMAFLYSDPLMQKRGGKDEPFNDPLDTEKEFQHLCRFLGTHNPKKQFYVKREAATFQSLSQIIQQQPTILHISCHGLPKDKDRPTFSLAFESAEERGYLELVSEQKLKRLLNLGAKSDQLDETSEDSVMKYPVKLVFVSACYSEPIGLLFKKANVPIVIAVNSLTPIADDYARNFTQNFYDSLIKGTITPKKAFEVAKNMINGKDKDKFCCCCNHSHELDCKYSKYLNEKGLKSDCKLHTPTCKCSRRYEGYHHMDCNFLSQFKYKLDIGVTDKDIEKIQLLCCCKSNQPHNENQKIMIVKRPPLVLLTEEEINKKPEDQRVKIREDQQQRQFIESLLIKRDEDFLNQPLFENLKDKKTGGGVFIRDNEMQEVTRMPDVMDDLQVVSRNQEVTMIVNQLDIAKDGSKIIHIYGSEGVGKTGIARYSAKFCLNRHFFPQGVFYVSLVNKSEKHSFIETIYDRLNISRQGAFSINDTSMSQPLNTLIERIKQRRILILIDDCQQIIKENRQDFNFLLKELAKYTEDVRFIVISENEEDLDQNMHLWRIQIKELTVKQAAQVMWFACKDLNRLAAYNNSDELSKHQIFQTQTTFKPHQVIQLSQHLKEGQTLNKIYQDQIAEENKRREIAEKIKTQNGGSTVINTLADAQFCSMTNMTMRKVKLNFESQFKMFLILCQFPQGLFESDLDFISLNTKPQINGWRDFMNNICQDPSQNALNEGQENSKTSFRLVHQHKFEDLNELHFCPIHKFSNYTNTEWFDDENNMKQQIFTECLAYQAKISRKILRGIKYQSSIDFDIDIVSSIIDAGIWGEEETTAQKILTSEEIEEIMRAQSKAEVKFMETEANFSHFLDFKVLNLYTTMINYEKDYAQHIKELCINTASIYLKSNKIMNAMSILQKGKQIADKFSDKKFKALIILVEVSCAIKQLKEYNVIMNMLTEPISTFKTLQLQDGEADTYYIKGMQSIKYILLRMNQTQQFEANSSQHSFRRQQSYQDTQSAGQLNNQYPSATPRTTKHVHNHHQSSTNVFSDYSNLCQNSLQQSINEAIDYLKTAKKLYEKCKNQYGIAKTILVIAEFYVDESLVEFKHNEIKNWILDAIEVFRNLKLEALEARSLKILAVLELRHIQSYLKAKEHIEAAKSIAERLNDRNHFLYYTNILNQILIQIHIEASNVFIFAKAFPLVEVVGMDDIMVAGSLTRHVNTFRNRILDKIDHAKKVINVKFDSLTRDVLIFIKKYGCRVLHLSSDVFKPDYLCIEGANGKIDNIHLDELKELLQPENNEKLNVNLVVLAIPESKKLAQVFVDLGVQHVVAFDFEVQIGLDNVKYLPRRFEQIYHICEQFYIKLIQEQSVKDALENAVEYYEKILKPRNKKKAPDGENQSDSMSDIDDLNSYDSDGCFKKTEILKDDSEDEYFFSIFNGGPILLPEYGNLDSKGHNRKLFNQNSKSKRKHLQEGPLLNSSQRRGNTNIDKLRQLTPYTGRQKETYLAITRIKDQRLHIVNYCGPSGIGKTRFLIETGYFFLSRFEFTDGIYYLDLKNMRTVHQLQMKLQELNIAGNDVAADLENKNLLLLFDNIDGLLAHNIKQLRWFLLNIFAKSNTVKILVTSKSRLNHKEFHDMNDVIRSRILRPLSDIEAADMILSYVQFESNRRITKSEFQVDECQTVKRSIHLQLQLEGKVKECYGFPKHLHAFANLLKTKKFHKINITSYIPQSESKKEVMRHWKANHEESGATQIQGKQFQNSNNKNSITPNPQSQASTNQFQQQKSLNKKDIQKTQKQFSKKEKQQKQKDFHSQSSLKKQGSLDQSFESFDDQKVKKSNQTSGNMKKNKFVSTVNLDSNGKKKTIMSVVNEEDEIKGIQYSAGKRGSNKKGDDGGGSTNYNEDEGQAFITKEGNITDFSQLGSYDSQVTLHLPMLGLIKSISQMSQDQQSEYRSRANSDFHTNDPLIVEQYKQAQSILVQKKLKQLVQQDPRSQLNSYNIIQEVSENSESVIHNSLALNDQSTHHSKREIDDDDEYEDDDSSNQQTMRDGTSSNLEDSFIQGLDQLTLGRYYSKQSNGSIYSNIIGSGSQGYLQSGVQTSEQDTGPANLLGITSSGKGTMSDISSNSLSRQFLENGKKGSSGHHYSKKKKKIQGQVGSNRKSSGHKADVFKGKNKNQWREIVKNKNRGGILTEHVDATAEPVDEENESVENEEEFVKESEQNITQGKNNGGSGKSYPAQGLQNNNQHQRKMAKKNQKLEKQKSIHQKHLDVGMFPDLISPIEEEKDEVLMEPKLLGCTSLNSLFLQNQKSSQLNKQQEETQAPSSDEDAGRNEADLNNESENSGDDEGFQNV